MIGGDASANFDCLVQESLYMLFCTSTGEVICTSHTYLMLGTEELIGTSHTYLILSTEEVICTLHTCLTLGGLICGSPQAQKGIHEEEIPFPGRLERGKALPSVQSARTGSESASRYGHGGSVISPTSPYAQAQPSQVPGQPTVQ